MIKDQRSTYECAQALMNHCHVTCQSTQEVWHRCRCNPGDWQLEGFSSKRGQKNDTCRPSSALYNMLCVRVFEQQCLNHCCSCCRGNCCDSPVYWEKNRYEFSHTHTDQDGNTPLGNKQKSNLIILPLQSSKTPAAPRFFYLVLLYMYDWFHSGADANARKKNACLQ